MQKPAMFYPLLLLVFWTGLMLTADYVVIETSVRQALSVNFVCTTGKMVRSEIGHGAVSHRGIEIGYNYDVNGINYTGHHYRYDDRNAAWEYSAAVGAFPRWSERKVYYNPNDPGDSLLDPGLDGCDSVAPAVRHSAQRCDGGALGGRGAVQTRKEARRNRRGSPHPQEGRGNPGAIGGDFSRCRRACRPRRGVVCLFLSGRLDGWFCADYDGNACCLGVGPGRRHDSLRMDVEKEPVREL